MNLRAYAVGDCREMETAVLAFARTAREARNLAAPWLVDGYGCCEWTDVRARWLRDGASVWDDGSGEPRVLEPEGCEACFRWWSDWRPTEEERVCPECRDPEAGEWS